MGAYLEFFDEDRRRPAVAEAGKDEEKRGESEECSGARVNLLCG